MAIEREKERERKRLYRHENERGKEMSKKESQIQCIFHLCQGLL